MKYKLIIFDFDGTLVDTKSKLNNIFKELSKKYKTSNNTLKELIIEEKRDTIKNENLILSEFEELVLNYTNTFFEGCENFLEELRRNVDIGILTRAPRRFVIDDINKSSFNITDFKFIQAFEDSKYQKPDPRVFDNILKEYNELNRNEIVYIGDSIDDFIVSTESGIDFIGIQHTKKTDLPDNIKIAKSFIELSQILNP